MSENILGEVFNSANTGESKLRRKSDNERVTPHGSSEKYFAN